MFLGIDLGTSSVKAVLLDRGHRLIATATAALSVNSPQPLWREQHPHFLGQLVFRFHLPNQIVDIRPAQPGGCNPAAVHQDVRSAHDGAPCRLYVLALSVKRLTKRAKSRRQLARRSSAGD